MDSRAKLFTFTALAIACLPVKAGSLHELWRVDLRKWYDAEGAVESQMPVRHVTFSPDGTKVAVVVNRYGGRGRLPDALFVINVASHAKDPREFDTDSRTVGEGSPLVDFSWSPSGDLIDSGGEVIRLADGSRCHVPQFGGFLGNDEIVADISGAGGDRRPSRFGVYDAECNLKSTWDSEANFLKAISPQSRIALMSKLGPPGEDLMVDPENGALLRSWNGTERSTARFANHGQQMCGIVPSHSGAQTTIACWDTGSEDRVAMAPVNGGTPFATSLGSSRMILSEYLYVPTVLREDPLNVFKQCLIWDFKTGQKVAVWRPPYYRYIGTGAKRLSDFAKFALSPDGDSVVQAGDGVVTYFRIQE